MLSGGFWYEDNAAVAIIELVLSGLLTFFGVIVFSWFIHSVAKSKHKLGKRSIW